MNANRPGTDICFPTTLGEALGRLATNPSTPIVAGATALQLDWKRTGWPAALMDLSRMKGLSGIAAAQQGGMRIGAMTTLEALRQHPRLRSHYPSLTDTLGEIASPGIRSIGTIGGNVARRSGCAVPVLAALGAQVQVTQASGSTEMPLLDWLNAMDGAPPKILVAILLPTPPQLSCAEKIGLRFGFSPSVIGTAASLRLDPDGRITTACFCIGGGVAPRALEHDPALLAGRRVEEVAWRAVRSALAGAIAAGARTDAFRSARYKAIAASNAMVFGLAASAKAALGDPPARRHPVPPTPAVPALPQALLTRSDCPAWPVRPDIIGKINGSLRYLTDVRQDGMLVGRILRSGIQHARILRLDTSRAQLLPGVRAVVTAKDVPGLNAFGIIVQDQPVFCTDKVRHAGDSVAAVAAIDAATAERALALIEVEYQPLPVIADMTAALAQGAEPIHAAGNLHFSDQYARGDVNSGWADCAHIVEDTYVTPRQMHVFMETEGGFARPGPGGTLEVFVGAQSNYRDRMQLARILGMAEEKIRIVTSPTGGSFGGKDELTVQPALVLLALKANAPVRLHLDREESTITGWKRTPFTIRMRTGCDAGGRLIAQEVELLVETGAYGSWSGAVMEAALEHSCGPYLIPHLRQAGKVIYTNNGVCGAFRGFGVNQMTFAIESQIDRLAERVGLDAVAMRKLNLRPAGSGGVYQQQLSGSERLVELLDYAALSDLWRKPRGLDPAGRYLTGVGVALVAQGCGLGSLIPDSGGGRIGLLADGRIEAAFSFDEFGQGVMALIQALVAAELGCARADIAPVVGDTAAAPDSGPTIASRSVTIAGQVARRLAPLLRRQMLEKAALVLDCSPTELSLGAGGVSAGGTLRLSFAELAARLGPDRLPSETCTMDFPKNDSRDRNTLFLHSYSATLAQVRVDRVTGLVRVLALDQHTAAGPVMDPGGYLGQIEGGGVQGAGFTLCEDALMEAGKYLTTNLDTYLVPTTLDAPQAMRTYVMEALDPGDPHGPRGIGELAIGAIAPAIISAVADATGAWITRLPLDPEGLLNAVATEEAAP